MADGQKGGRSPRPQCPTSPHYSAACNKARPMLKQSHTSPDPPVRKYDDRTRRDGAATDEIIKGIPSLSHLWGDPIQERACNRYTTKGAGRSTRVDRPSATPLPHSPPRSTVEGRVGRGVTSADNQDHRAGRRDGTRRASDTIQAIGQARPICQPSTKSSRNPLSSPLPMYTARTLKI